MTLTLDEIKQLLVAKKWDAASQAASDLLRQRPALAQAWVFLGEALEQQSAHDAAWQAYNRAWILDPQAMWVKSMIERIGQRSHTEPPEWLSELLKVPEVSVTAVIIARNEEENIRQAVTRLLPAVDKVVVIDTGSVDETAMLARDAGAFVHTVEWQNDFAAARNIAHSIVDSEWILWADADEWLYLEDVEVPRIVAGLFKSRNVILRIGQANHVGSTLKTNYDMSRMYPTDKALRWWGRIHEQVGPAEGVYFGGFAKPAVRIRFEHHGYKKEVMERKGKLNRNISLLELTVRDDPDDVAAWGFLGRDRLAAGDMEAAVEALYTAETLAVQRPEYGRLSEVRCGLISALMALDRLEEAMNVAKRQIESNPEYPGGWYLHGQCALRLGAKYLADAEASHRRAAETAPGYRGIVAYDEAIPQFKAQLGRADALRLMGHWVDAIALYEGTHKTAENPVPVMRQMGDMVQQAKRLSGMVMVGN